MAVNRKKSPLPPEKPDGPSSSADDRVRGGRTVGEMWPWLLIGGSLLWALWLGWRCAEYIIGAVPLLADIDQNLRSLSVGWKLALLPLVLAGCITWLLLPILSFWLGDSLTSRDHESIKVRLVRTTRDVGGAVAGLTLFAMFWGTAALFFMLFGRLLDVAAVLIFLGWLTVQAGRSLAQRRRFKGLQQL